jgi:beta-lactamase class A
MKKLLAISLIFLLGSTTMPQDKLSVLKQNIIQAFDSVEGNFALSFKDLSDEKNIILINEKEVFHAASTMKTPVMIEVFKQSSQGRFNLNDSIVIHNKFKSIVDGSDYSMDISDDSGEDLYKYVGMKRTIRELVYDMITVSSNLATNILIDLVSADNVMITMHEIGANDIKVLRGVEDIKAFELGLNNTTTVLDLLIIFEKIAKKEVVSEKACDEMINILSEQKFNDRIPALLPDNVKVAHKTGSITGVGHDSGIIFLPNGKKYILILLSKNLNDEQAGREVQAKVSKMLYDFMISE